MRCGHEWLALQPIVARVRPDRAPSYQASRPRTSFGDLLANGTAVRRQPIRCLLEMICGAASPDPRPVGQPLGDSWIRR